jgi:hypothetical protein
MSRLALPTVTLCAITSTNVCATAAALEACLAQVEFAQALLLTDSDFCPSHPDLKVVQIPGIRSANEYSRFLLENLVDYIDSEYCLIVQWDGFILDALQWHQTFLTFDYIGAPWPHFSDGHDVGNGGFSLRSRRLLEACRDARFRHGAAEDVAICRVNRHFLEDECGLRFADRTTAEQFAFERALPTSPTFGFHGVFNMIKAVGPDRFWELYSALDDRTSVFTDFYALMSQLGRSHHGWKRNLRMTTHRLERVFYGRFRG